MAYSKDFCIERISTMRAISDEFKNDIDFDQLVEIEPQQYFDRYINVERKYSIKKEYENGDHTEISVELKFNERANFDYFVSKTSVHDGTFLFVEEAICQAVKRIITADTYMKPKGEPKNGDKIVYEIGKIVIANEDSERFSTKNKPFMTCRTSVLIPVKYEKIGCK